MKYKCVNKNNKTNGSTSQPEIIEVGKEKELLHPGVLLRWNVDRYSENIDRFGRRYLLFYLASVLSF